VKEKLAKEDVVGIVTSRTVDDGKTLVMVAGHKGSEGGAPSATTELVARECAIRPRASAGEPL